MAVCWHCWLGVVGNARDHVLLLGARQQTKRKWSGGRGRQAVTLDHSVSSRGASVTLDLDVP